MVIFFQNIFNRPCVAGAVLQTALSLMQSFSKSWFVKISLQHRHAQTVGNGAFGHKIDYIAIFKEILNPVEHQNRITGS